jgi:TetR/AcrR family transcriptional repressor of bet genes
MNDCSFIAKVVFVLYIIFSMKAARKKRTAPKEERQLQLIRATIRSVAQNGLSDTTMATVAREAGLSQGIINLHFQSKERLLVETLRHLSEQYRAAWKKALSSAGDRPEERLEAMVAMDFKPPICEQNKLAVWFAFWGESKSRPTYRKICASRDMAYRAEMVQVCDELIEKGGYVGLDAGEVAAGLSAMTSGLWLDLLTNPRSMSRERARQICMAYLASTFPRHFS